MTGWTADGLDTCSGQSLEQWMELFTTWLAVQSYLSPARTEQARPCLDGL